MVRIKIEGPCTLHSPNPQELARIIESALKAAGKRVPEVHFVDATTVTLVVEEV